MGGPITTAESTATYTRHERQWTYEEMLELFSDDTNLVRPLVLRCMEYEAKLKRISDQLLNGTLCRRTDTDSGDGIVTIRFANSIDAVEFADELENLP
jgi:hypothetical protein